MVKNHSAIEAIDCLHSATGKPASPCGI